jgi:hypothetical protein
MPALDGVLRPAIDQPLQNTLEGFDEGAERRSRSLAVLAGVRRLP